MNQFLESVCVTHEIDALAENNRHVLSIECKYHNKQGLLSDVKVPLYICSRYRNVQERWNKTLQKNRWKVGWLTIPSFLLRGKIWYLCRPAPARMELPIQKSLSRLVDESGLYPVTILSTLTNKEKEQILKAGLMLCKNLAKNEELVRQTAITQTGMPRILADMETLC